MKAGAYDQAKQEALARTKRRKRDPGDKNWVYNVWTKPMPLLSELMSSHTSAPPLPDGQVLLEAGVLAYRRQKHGELQILLVSKKRSKKWGIPKGRAEPHMSFSEIAAKEAFEEAGVIGYISPNSVGMFRARKQSTSGLPHQIIDVWVYLFEVREIRRKWPEMHKRETRCVSCQAAAQHLREPLLANICHRLSQNQ
jgi:8-oxo-dGTP pyrophosphatase MutT (NUDIX family)